MKPIHRALLVLMLLPLLLGASTPYQPTIERVYGWKSLVEEACPDMDPLLILSIIAQESNGNPKAIREEGSGLESVGLMQIMTFSWRPSKEWLLVPKNNIEYGCRILRQIQDKGDLSYQLAIYNCGEVRVRENRCGPYGGYAYSEQVLLVWYPILFEYGGHVRFLRRMELIHFKLRLKNLDSLF